MKPANFTSDFFRTIPPAARWLPKYEQHMTPQVVRLDDRRLLICIRLSGMPFESVSDQAIKTAFDALANTFTTLGRSYANRLEIVATLHRKRIRFDQTYRFKTMFLREVTGKYLDRFRSEKYFENGFYLSLLLTYNDLEDGLKDAGDLIEQCRQAFRPYDPEILETYEHNGILFSNVYKFLGLIWNGAEEEYAVTVTPARELLPSTYMHFDYDTAECRYDNRTRYISCYDLKEFPKAGWGQLNPLLSIQAEFTLTQSFFTLASHVAIKAISAQENKLLSVGDKAQHQIDELRQATSLIQGGDLCFGDYHCALVVWADSQKQAINNGHLVATRANDQCGFKFVKANASAVVTFASQMPGQKTKPRPMPKSSVNLASAFTLHDYSAGKSTGNPVGDGSAVAPFQTVSKKLYNFNFHATRDDTSNMGERVAGHTVVLGSTGVGKTALQSLLTTFFERFDPMYFGLDYGRGMEILARQLGITYIALAAGEPTGLAPFGLSDTPVTRQHWYDLVALCGADRDGKISATERRQVQEAVNAVADLADPKTRTFSRLLESIPELEGDSLYTRLSQWCYATQGQFAWVFDNVPGSMIDVTRLARGVFIDVSAFLTDRNPTSEALFSHVFYLKRLMKATQPGRLMLSIIEEAWMPLKFPMIVASVEQTLSAGRKEGEFMILVTQQPEQLIRSPVFPQIRSLTATKIFLPDPEAEWASYERTNMTPKEFSELKKLEKHSRTFLVKQGNQSAFATFDMHGMDDEMAVLSSTPENITLMHECIAEFGDEPDAWLRPFQERVFSRRTTEKLAERFQEDPVGLAKSVSEQVQLWRERKASEVARFHQLDA